MASRIIYRRLKEQMEEMELEGEYQKFKEKVEEELKENYAIKWIHALIQEMNEAERRQFAKMIQLQNVRLKKAVSELILMKEIAMICRGGSDMHYSGKKRCILALLQTVQPIIDLEKDLHELIQRREEILSRYGPWHYYWAIYFHPEKGSKLWSEEIARLEEGNPHIAEQEEGKEGEDPERRKEDQQVHAMESRSDMDDQRNKIDKLEQKVKKEMETRIVLEKELDQKRKEGNRLEKEIKTQKESVRQLQENNEKLKIEIKKLLSDGGEERRRFQARQQEWIEERTQHYQEQKRLRQEAEMAQEKLQQEIQRKEKEIRDLRQEMSRLQRPKGLEAQLVELKRALYGDVTELNQKLISGFGTPEERHLRTKVRARIDFLDEIDRFRDHLLGIPTPSSEQKGSYGGDGMSMNPDTDRRGVNQVVIPGDQDEEDQVEEDQVEEGVGAARGGGETDSDAMTGIFYRRDHGGYIELEDGKTFSISESLVLNLGLEHGAGVACTPTDQGRYYIKLLYPGDDSASQVKKYFGYVELGEYHRWYCVDHGNPEVRFLIHQKDLNILQPQDGAPCNFNVFEGNYIARISRLYPITSNETERGGGGKAEARTVRSLPKKEEEISGEEEKEKMIPDLSGCRIVIVGGQRKWFEDVVLETGAALIHDDGQTPERIYADLKKANALFFLLTANSHRATWGCMEIAKDYSVPHYIIRGSKSNLRSMLWEHQDEIRGLPEVDPASGM